MERSLPIVHCAPMVAPAHTRVGSVSSSGSEGRSFLKSGVVARGKRSLVNTVPALTMTPSSIVTALQMYTKLLILTRSEEHTSELQSQSNLVCRLLLEKKKT